MARKEKKTMYKTNQARIIVLLQYYLQF